MKCNNCGETISDGAKFCKFCGAKIEAAPTVECPSCGKALEPDSGFCAYCGAKLKRESFVVCPNCGAKDTEDSKFCGECGADVSKVERTHKLVVDGEAETRKDIADGEKNAASAADRSEQKPAAAVQTERKSVANTAVKIKEKAVGFENKTYMIRNVLITVMAIMFALFALLMPVKIVGCDENGMIFTEGQDDILDILQSDLTGDDEEVEDIELECHPAAISQHIWHIFGALQYIGVDVESSSDDKKKVDELNKKITEAIAEAQAEAFNKYAVRVPGVSDYAVPASKQKAYIRAYEKALNKYLSRENYLGYLIANDCYDYYYYDDVNDADPGKYVNDLVTLIVMLVVTAIAFAITGISIVWLVFALIGIAFRKQKLRIEKLLAVVVILSMIGLTLTVFAPLGKAGGGMLAIMLAAVAACFVVGAMKIASGETRVFDYVKSAAVAVPSILCLILLCTNTIALMAKIEVTYLSILEGKDNITANLSIKVTAPIGIFLEEAISSAASMIMIAPEMDMTGVAISGFVSYGLTVVAVIALVMSSIAASLSLIGKKSPLRVPSVVAAEFLLALIIFTGGATASICESYADILIIDYFKIRPVIWFVMRTQTYFAMFLSIGTFLASLLIREKKKPQSVGASEEKSEEPAEAKNESVAEEPQEQSTEDNNPA